MYGIKHKIKSVDKVILVAAGKGGVGKSTVSFLLAKQLAEKGYKVGILDADIYGPSIPTLMNIAEKEPLSENNIFIPIKAEDIQVMSIGFIIKKEQALAWRGPMLAKALNQLLFGVQWGELDYLIVDMPPGTGDIHLSIIQKCEIEGAILVTIPDKLSEIDVVRAADLYVKTNVPILGVVENMSYLEMNGNKISLFGGSAASSLAEKFNIKIIASLPLVPNLSQQTELYNLKEFEINFDR